MLLMTLRYVMKCERFLLRMLSLFCKDYYLDFKKWVKSLDIEV
jgi:hypothetical protein